MLRPMELIVDIAVTEAGQFKGTVDAGSEAPAEFSGTLELLRLLENATQPELGAAGAR